MMLSVVIPFHDEINLIRATLDSVMANSIAELDMEIIICNDGDIPDDEVRLKLGSASRELTRIIRNVHAKGPGGARNTGLDESVGDYIAFLDADDVWLPGKVAAHLSAIRAGATFVATAYRFDSVQTLVKPPAFIDQALDIFLYRGIGTSTVMISRKLLSNLRFKDIRFAQDIDFWYALACSPHFRYAAVDSCYVEYSTRGSTKNKWVQLLYLYKVLRINDVPYRQHIRILFSYVLTGIYNHYIKRLFA